MGTVISPDGCFEWDENKNILNNEKHGFFFDEVLAIFDDPFFLEAYDRDNSERYDENYQKQISHYEQ